MAKRKMDSRFIPRLKVILKICFPKGSPERKSLLTLTILLVMRTWFSIYIAKFAGWNGQMLVKKNWPGFLRGVVMYLALTLPSAACNSMIKFVTNQASMGVRVRLSEHLHTKYLSGVNFYKAISLGSDLTNPDQTVTTDITMFSDSVCNLFVETVKPLLDAVLFTFQLVQILSWQGPCIMYSYFLISGVLKKKIMPSFGKLVAIESQLEGHYRTAHSRLVTNAEEIAFYAGGEKEKNIILQALRDVNEHMLSLRWKRALVGIFDGLLVKYWASIAGYLSVISPYVLQLEHVQGQSTDEITRDYILNSQFLTGLSTAIGQLLLLMNKATDLSGYTQQVSELLEAVEGFNEKGTEIFKEREEEDESGEFSHVDSSNLDWLGSWKVRCDHRRGETEGNDLIRFHEVDLVAPDGQLLVKGLSFSVESGVNVMVTGPNGCGKSSLFRVIGGLWPQQCGEIVKPPREEVLFVPQKPYLVLGSLRDQIIYPHSVAEMRSRHVTDEDLEKLLETVDPSKTILSNWEWDTVHDWSKALSGGQKQRVAMARVFYHRPSFAILDECTSCVSDEVEDAIYTTCRLLGITLFSVSHRPALRRFHSLELTFDGRGNWEFLEIPK